MASRIDMANILGHKVLTDEIDFSFYFGMRNNLKHSIRVEIVWNRDSMRCDNTGRMKLHGSYEYRSFSGSDRASGKVIESARSFFKKYKILFTAVWDGGLAEDELQEYFSGTKTFNELKECFIKRANISGQHVDNVRNLSTISRLECYVRESELINMYD